MFDWIKTKMNTRRFKQYVELNRKYDIIMQELPQETQVRIVNTTNALLEAANIMRYEHEGRISVPDWKSSEITKQFGLIVVLLLKENERRTKK
jgi:hypothetical protein